MISGVNEEELELSEARMDIMLATNYTTENPGPLAIIDKYHDKEIKRLKNGYCELKVKCNNGECDCTNEEYDGMVQANMRGSLLLDDYKSRCEKASKIVKDIFKDGNWYNNYDYNDLENALKEVDKILNGDE